MERVVCVSKKGTYAVLIACCLVFALIVIAQLTTTHSNILRSKASEHSTPRFIVDGKNSSITEWPFVVVLFDEFSNGEVKPATPQLIIKNNVTIPTMYYTLQLKGPNRLCSGSLLSNEWLITAAHCMRAYMGDTRTLSEQLKETHEVRVAIGFDNFGSPQIVDNKKTFVLGINENEIHYPSSYKKYGASSLDDIAVVKLKPTLYSPFIGLVKTPSVSYVDETVIIPPHVSTTVIGWGITSYSFHSPLTESDFSDRMQEIALETMTYDDALQKKLGPFEDNDAVFLYTGSVGRGFSFGDSGGPNMYYSRALAKWILIGLSSQVTFSLDKTAPEGVGESLLVAPYAQWIRETTGISPNSGAFIGTDPSLSIHGR